MDEQPLRTQRRTARLAGAFYLVMALTGPVAILLVPSRVVVAGDAAATAAQVLEHAGLVRAGVLAGLVCQVAFVLTALALDTVFADDVPWLRRAMLALVVAGAPVAVVGELLPLAALSVAGDPAWAGLALPAFELHAQATILASAFWGLWLFPFGALVVRSGRMPKVLGWLLGLGGTAYLVDVTLGLVWPDVRAAVTDVLLLPLAIGELSMVVWLLVWGVRERR